MERICTQALLCRSVDYRESDRICTLLTQSQGKLSALARGARRSRKRYGGALALFVLGEATLGRGRGELLNLERFDMVEDFSHGIGADLVKVAHGSYLLELTREMWPEQQPELRAFELLCETLRRLCQGPPLPALLRAFELQLLAQLGFAPVLDRCVRCGKEDPDDGGFDLAGGGALCGSCGPWAVPLSAASRRMLLRWSEVGVGEVDKHPATVAVARQCRAVMLEVVLAATGKRLKSLDFILQLKSGGPGSASR